MEGSQEGNRVSETIFIWARTAVLCAVFIALVTGAYSAYTWAKLLTPSRTIVVSAEGTALLKPDIATISFSVLSEGENIATIQADNTAKMNAAIALVKAAGVADVDIKTSSYSLSPKYKYDQKIGRSTIDGYQISQTVTVKVRALDTAGAIVASLPTAGINQISGPDFRVEDADASLGAARTEAFTKARTKAQVLARAAGVGLGRVITFSESSGGGYPQPMYMRVAGMGGDIGASTPEFQAGTDEVKVTVSVTFEIR